jgi:predicted nucleic acid-binding protein
LAGVLFDSSVYIESLRRGTDMIGLRWQAAGRPVWLSAVVLAELYAGAYGKSRKAVSELERDFERNSRLLVPDHLAWRRTGQVLSQLRRKYDLDSVGRVRLMNDLLIATSAGGAGITVLTHNLRDFDRIGEFVTFEWMSP